MRRALTASLAAFFVLAAVAPAASAPRPTSGKWSGKTSQDAPASAKAKNHKFKKLNVKWTAACENPPDATDTAHFKGVKVGTSGKFSATAAKGGSTASDGSFAIDYKLKGKMKTTTKASGTLKVTVNYFDAGGNPQGHCESGKISWTLKHT